MTPVSPAANSTTNTLRIFLASPGGVEVEREAIRRLADEISVPFRRKGWQVEILGWEDRGPASGRAQAEINADVDRCNIFLGIVWDRWGTPTGEYSSGFEEEWTRARKRWEMDGAPDLWLCFKEVDEERIGAGDDAQLAHVIRFREAIERDEVAFHKPFRSPAELESAIRRELTEQLLERANVSADSVEAVAIDWTSALAHEPVALLPDGRERDRLASELSTNDPVKAAEILKELAPELEELGFTDLADSYRKRAATALIGAERHDQALALWRQVLLRALESHHPTDFEFAARELGEKLPPEQYWEARAWQACIEWPLDREKSIASLTSALRAADGEGLDKAVVRLWRRTLWELWLEDGNPEMILTEAQAPGTVDALNTDDELGLLFAEAQSAQSEDAGAEKWARLRARSVEIAKSEPLGAARLSARHAVQLTAKGSWTEAEEGFIRAATLLSGTAGNEEESAEYFFSAAAVSRLSGEMFAFKGWSWRPMAASLRSARETPMTRATRYERGGLAAQVAGRHDDARREFSLGRAVHRRAGHLRGVLAMTRSLADAHRAAGDAIEATIDYCHCGDGEEAKKAARKVTTSRELTDRLPIGKREWETLASCVVLTERGRFTSPERAAEILPFVLELSRRSTKESGSVAMTGSEALAQICVALGDEHLGEATTRLCELLSTDHNALSRSGGEGLRMLIELKRIDGAEALIHTFANSPENSVLWPSWVAERLSDPHAIAAVRDAGLRGQPLALLALGLAGLIDGDRGLEVACTAYATRISESDIGRGPNGSILGLVGFDTIGGIASHCPSEEIRRMIAEKLLLYALETYWPMVNRTTAVAGTYHLAKSLNGGEFVERLRPLAAPDSDLDDQSDMPFSMDMAVEGELEAQALRACVDLSREIGVPGWLRDAVLGARIDQRAKLRAAAWFCASMAEELGDRGALEMAMIDEEHEVRAAAVVAWRKLLPDELPPEKLLDRLLADPLGQSRQQLLALAEQYELPSDHPIAEKLLGDADAYLARSAFLAFRGNSEPIQTIEANG
jgi:hypothetical protein